MDLSCLWNWIKNLHLDNVWVPCQDMKGWNWPSHSYSYFNNCKRIKRFIVTLGLQIYSNFHRVLKLSTLSSYEVKDKEQISILLCLKPFKIIGSIGRQKFQTPTRIKNLTTPLMYMLLAVFYMSLWQGATLLKVNLVPIMLNIQNCKVKI